MPPHLLRQKADRGAGACTCSSFEHEMVEGRRNRHAALLVALQWIYTKGDPPLLLSKWSQTRGKEGNPLLLLLKQCERGEGEDILSAGISRDGTASK